jgi:hypothetical protein
MVYGKTRLVDGETMIDDIKDISVLVHEGAIGGVDVVLRDPSGDTFDVGTIIHWLVVLYNDAASGEPGLVFVRLKRNENIIETHEYLLEPSTGIPFDFYDPLPVGQQKYFFQAGVIENEIYHVNEASPDEYILGVYQGPIGRT